MKKLKSINLLTRHGDKNHFKVKRQNNRPAEALIEKKYFFLYHVIVYDGTKIFEGTVTLKRLNVLLMKINKGFPNTKTIPTCQYFGGNHETTY